MNKLMIKYKKYLVLFVLILFFLGGSKYALSKLKPIISMVQTQVVKKNNLLASMEQNLQSMQETIGTNINKIDDSLSSSIVNLKINDELVNIDLTKNNVVINANKLFAEFPNVINLEVGSNIEVFIDNEKIINGSTINITSLNKGTYKNVVIKKGDVNRIYKLEILPESFSNINYVFNKEIQGDIYSNFINDNGESYIYKMDNNGNILFYYKNSYDGNGSLMNFNKHVTPSGEVRYSYFEPTIETNTSYKNGLNFGNIVLMDEKYNIVKKIGLNKTNINSNELTENHEFIYYDDNHYVVSGAIDKSMISNNQHIIVKAAYFQEVKDNTVIFEWCSTNDSSLLVESVEENNYNSTSSSSAADYVHINSIDIDPKDNNFICSFRNQDCIVKISRDTGKIMWKLGGKGDNFNLSESQKTSRQHYAKYQEDGSILIFDNGNSNQQTRIVKFVLDEDNKKVIEFKEYKVGNKFSVACGSVQSYDLKNEVFTIGWGFSTKDKVIMSVVDFKNNEILAEVYTDQAIRTYRSLIFY